MNPVPFLLGVPVRPPYILRFLHNYGFAPVRRKFCSNAANTIRNALLARTQATPVIIQFIPPNAAPTKIPRLEPFISAPIHPKNDVMVCMASGRTHIIYSHYDILSDIMLILDHGNICVDTMFMIIIMHSFPDIEENLFSIMAVLICIHIICI